MKKNGTTLVRIIGITMLLGVLAAILIPQFTEPKSEKEVTVTEKSYHWSYPFPSANEFKESDRYSMVWIGESGWIEKRFLLVKAKRGHMDYGHIPYLLKAVSDVERKGYIIVSKEFLSISKDFGHIDGLLLEVRSSEDTEDTEDTGKRHP